MHALAVALAAAPPADYSSVETARLAGITYRQLDYWTRADVVTPAGAGHGQGVLRRYSRQQVVALRACARLADLGAGVPAMRPLARAVLELDLATLPRVAAVNRAGEVLLGPGLELERIRSSWLVLIDLPPEAE